MPKVPEVIDLRLRELEQKLDHQGAVDTDTQRVVMDTRQAVQQVAKELAHTRGALTEVRQLVDHVAEELAHTRGALIDVRRLVDDVRGQIDAAQSLDDPFPRLTALLRRVEPYQPLYGLEGLLESANRASVDRAKEIELALGGVAGRRILDLGSSLGYFPLYFADRGAYCEGWDFKPDNVAISRLVAQLTGNSAQFRLRTIDPDAVRTVRHAEFDIVLCLSILHHVIAHEGLSATQDLVAALLDRAPVLILELARKGEDPSLYWDASQPADPMEVLASAQGVEITQLGEFGTHLSEESRPLVMVRRKDVITVAGRIFDLDTVATEPYPDAPIGDARPTRRYHMGPEVVVKQYWLSDAHPENWRQIITELHFFTALLPLHPVYRAPRLVAHEFSDTMAKLALERVPGRMLDECAPLSETTVEHLVLDVLRTLADLRAIGMHHNDVRSWNIVVNESGGWLIDYGLCGPVANSDDVEGLLWAASAGVTGVREPADREEGALPDVGMFSSSGLAAFHEAVTAGQRDPQALQNVLTRPEDGSGL